MIHMNNLHTIRPLCAKLLHPPRKSSNKIDNEKVYAPDSPPACPDAIYFYFILFSFYCENHDNSHC